jgi:hypothetical protein
MQELLSMWQSLDTFLPIQLSGVMEEFLSMSQHTASFQAIQFHDLDPTECLSNNNLEKGNFDPSKLVPPHEINGMDERDAE